MRQCGFQMANAMIQLRDITGKFLPQRQRRCVLQMRAANFHNVGEVARFIVQRPAQRLQRGNTRLTMPSALAICIAVGNTSFEDWPRLTSSFGGIARALPRPPPASSLARFAMTSFRFI